MDPYTQPKRALSGGFEQRNILSTAAVTQTLVTAYTDKPPAPVEEPLYHAIHIQRLRVVVMTGSAGKTWQFRSTAAGAVNLTPSLDMSTAGTEFSFDFGPQGAKLTTGRNFEVVISAAGAAADVYIEGFQERTGDPI